MHGCLDVLALGLCEGLGVLCYYFYMVGALSAAETYNNITTNSMILWSVAGQEEVVRPRVHVTHPHGKVPITSAFNVRVINVKGAFET